MAPIFSLVDFTHRSIMIFEWNVSPHCHWIVYISVYTHETTAGKVGLTAPDAQMTAFNPSSALRLDRLILKTQPPDCLVRRTSNNPYGGKQEWIQIHWSHGKCQIITHRITHNPTANTNFPHVPLREIVRCHESFWLSVLPDSTIKLPLKVQFVPSSYASPGTHD